MPIEKSSIKLPEGFVDLGEKMPDFAMPEMLHEAKESESEETGEHTHYPSLYFENAEGLKDLPTEGTATIHFKKLMEKTVKENRDGETSTRYCLELQINGLKPGEKSESSSFAMKEEESDEDAIEKGLSAASEGDEEDED